MCDGIPMYSSLLQHLKRVERKSQQQHKQLSNTNLFIPLLTLFLPFQTTNQHKNNHGCYEPTSRRPRAAHHRDVLGGNLSAVGQFDAVRMAYDLSHPYNSLVTIREEDVAAIYRHQAKNQLTRVGKLHSRTTISEPRGVESSGSDQGSTFPYQG